jgi:hypothetical protein
MPESPTLNPLFAQAMLDQWLWKNPSMRLMTVEICRLAVARGVAGEFSANDLPEFEHGGSGICGSIFKRLIDRGVLSRVGHFAGDSFYPKIVCNAGGNKIGVYRLASYALAQSLLRVHDKPLPELRQLELV